MGEVHVVLAQVAPAKLDILMSGLSRPWVVETVQRLLGADQSLKQIVTGNKPAILVFPELAHGFDDWVAIDDLVRAWPHPLVLIGGFGFTQGSRLTTWLAEGGPTQRRGAWPDDAAPASERVYNGGWCWVHCPGVTACMTFLKTTAEQQEEIHVDGLALGDFNVSLHLDDLIIFPVICSDLLCEQDGHHVVRRKISQYLDQTPHDTTKILIVGLLLQKKAHERWRTAITDIARSINTERVNICLVNSAHDILALHEEVDRWRDYSGVYIPKSRKAVPAQFASVRRFSTEQIDGAVIRATIPAVLGGPLRWTFDGPTGRHMWAVHKDYGVGAEGHLVDSPCSDRFRFETLRSLKRFTMAHDAPDDCKTDLAKACYATVAHQVSGMAPPNAEALCQKLLFGEPGREARDRLTADTLSAYITEISAGLKALGALKSATDIAWQAGKHKGQLRHQSKNVHVLIWCYPGSAVAMRQVILRWRSELANSPPLVVFKRATGMHYPTPHVSSARRQDITEPPPPSRRAADEATATPVIIEISLDEIEHCFDTNSATDFAAAINARIGAALAQLDGQAGQHA